MDDRSHAAREIVLLALLNVVFSVLGPLIARLLNAPLSVADELLLGTLLFCVGALLESLYYLVQLRERAVRQEAVWDAHHTVDARLASIRKSLRVLELGVEPNQDIFLKYYRNRIFQLEFELRQTASSRELRVDSSNLDLSEPLLDSFTGVETDIVRIVHFLAENAALFNVHEAQWFYRVHDAVCKRRVVEVRRLLVFADTSELEDELSLRLMGFLAHAEHYDYRVISKEHFERLTQSFRLQGEFIDFGIYGARYLFRGLIYKPGDFVGMYSRDMEEIERYRTFFDFCWQSPTSRTLDSSKLSLVKISELFN